MGRRLRQPLRHVGAGHRAARSRPARTWCSSSTCRARARSGRGGVAGDQRVRDAAVVRDPRAAAARAQQGQRGGRSSAGSQVARAEVAAFTEYDFIVINDDVQSAVDRLRAIVLAERSRLQRMRRNRRKHRQDVLNMIDRSQAVQLVRVRRHRRRPRAPAPGRLHAARRRRRAQEDHGRAAGSHHESGGEDSSREDVESGR